MTRYFAFLRAINVSGRTVKMDRLRELFEAIGFANVATFIASGNVIFESPSENSEELKRLIEVHLQESLGYVVDSFIRSAPELAGIASYQPFSNTAPAADATTLYISFLAGSPPHESHAKVLALQTPTDEFHIHGRELYWLRHGKISDSTISGALLEKSLGMPATMRNSNTVQRLVAKYPAS